MDTGLGEDKGEEEQKSHHDNRYRRLILRTPRGPRRGDRAETEGRMEQGRVVETAKISSSD